MVRHHKKTKKHSRRRRMRGGVFPFTKWDGSPWTAPAAAAATAAPAADVISKPIEHTLSLNPGGKSSTGEPILGPSAAIGNLGPKSAASGTAAGTGLEGGRRRRRTRKHRKSRRKH